MAKVQKLIIVARQQAARSYLLLEVQEVSLVERMRSNGRSFYLVSSDYMNNRDSGC